MPRPPLQLLRPIPFLLLALWPLRLALTGQPDSLTTPIGGGAWPLHLLAELITAGLLYLLTTAPPDRLRPRALLALGTLLYGLVNGLSYTLAGDPWQGGVLLLKLAAALLITQTLRTAAPVPAAPRWPGAVIALLGLGMIGYWSIALAGGIMAQGIWSTEGGAYLLFHIAAELLAGLTALTGGLLLLRRHPSALALTGAGGVLYAAVNSAGWAVLNDLALVGVFGITVSLLLLALWPLWRSARQSLAQPVTHRRTP